MIIYLFGEKYALYEKVDVNKADRYLDKELLIFKIINCWEKRKYDFLDLASNDILFTHTREKPISLKGFVKSQKCFVILIQDTEELNKVKYISGSCLWKMIENSKNHDIEKTVIKSNLKN